MHIQWAVRAQMEGMGVEIGMAYWGMGVVSFPGDGDWGFFGLVCGHAVWPLKLHI